MLLPDERPLPAASDFARPKRRRISDWAPARVAVFYEEQTLQSWLLFFRKDSRGRVDKPRLAHNSLKLEDSQERLVETLLLIPPNIRALLCCPACHSELEIAADQLSCTNSACRRKYPIVDGIPVLISQDSSVFSINDFISHHDTFFTTTAHGGIANLLRLVPSIGKNIKARPNFRRFSELLLQQSTLPLVLVIGGSVLGEGMDLLADNKSITLVETDVSFGPRTMLICDAHDIPFKDASFNGVVLQAVLEHVIDPYKCCDEVYQVSKEQALVYAETPFMQQVHAGRYDFTRFTHLGHRRLFRRFEEIDSGAVCGPGMALAWSYQYFLMSFANARPLRAAIRVIASMTSFFLKYLDYYLIEKPGALDAASGLYFMGRKAGEVLSDQELLRLYRGAQHSGGA